MVDLRLWMLGFGLLIGLTFPLVVVLLGVPRDLALRPRFFAATMTAGLMVAEVNHFLARTVVGVRLRSLISGLQSIEESMVDAENGGWAGSDPAASIVPVDSIDEFGEVAASFNRMLTGLAKVAAMDPLTGVYNRRAGLQRLTEEFARSIRSDDPLGVLMLDFDHFKAVNDTYGHLVGDRVLQTAVHAIREVLRDGDVLLRYGGEEFMIVLPRAGHDDLAQMAERVRGAVAEADITEAGRRIAITVSVGGAGLPDENATSAQDLIMVADAAMYTSKGSGRDRCIIT